MANLLDSSNLPKYKSRLTEFLPRTFPETVAFLEQTFGKELSELRYSILLFRIESWPGVCLESTYVGKYALDKARFVKHLRSSDICAIC